MVEFSMLRHLLLDNESLSCYESGDLVSFEDIKRRMQLLERKENHKLPDQFYRLATEKNFQELDNLEAVLSKGLLRLSDKYLGTNGNLITVKPALMNEWQYIITYCPPLLLKSSILYFHQPPASFTVTDLKKYFESHVLPNTRYTALPSPIITELDTLASNTNGFHDLHIHLNGTTETDIAWQDFLANPEKVRKYLSKAFGESLVRQQLEQESHQLTPRRFYSLIRIARHLRYLLYSLIFRTPPDPSFSSLKQWLGHIVYDDRYTSSGLRYHPFQSIIEPREGLPNHMGIEALMYIMIFNELSDKQNPILASLFHFYLLILGLSNRLLVQQSHQYGFEQFQKNTVNKLREFSEEEYQNRFFQIHGNELKHIKFVEGRFSPKEKERDNVNLVMAIEHGWNGLEKKLNDPIPDLRLVAHFIKKADTNPDPLIRHRELRQNVWLKAETLEALVRHYKKYRERITGVDAASNELDAPPEVFAPTFRMLKQKTSFKHYTYHVGEDFFHLISGMRSILEACLFLNLKKGDRIGHATAIGIDPLLWLKSMGENMLIRRSEWLDNLVFIKYVITTHSCQLQLTTEQLDKEYTIHYGIC